MTLLAARPPGRARTPASPGTTSFPLIAFCHLGWRGVWQRPQQLLSRLGRERPVLFVENHCSDVPESVSRDYVPADHPNVTVLETHMPAARWADGAFIDRERRRLVQDYVLRSGGRYSRPVLWFNDPMAVVPFAGQFAERAIVYDCMDELSQFKGAPRDLVVREEQLLRVADVVFCGGRKMREKRLPVNPNCHFYGTGVDCAHFGAARSEDCAVDPEIAGLPGRVFGYFGVVDERLDYKLLAGLADAQPGDSVAIVGPVVKVNPADLPRRPNLHWLGSRPYDRLPAITKGFTVCLMPFALNAATEFINPTKALEYMATGRPVVSTALGEVMTNFRGACAIGRSHEEFLAHCRRQADHPGVSIIRRGLQLARRSSWEAIVSQMEGHVDEVVAARAAGRKPEAAGAFLATGLNYV